MTPEERKQQKLCDEIRKRLTEEDMKSCLEGAGFCVYETGQELVEAVMEALLQGDFEYEILGRSARSVSLEYLGNHVDFDLERSPDPEAELETALKELGIPLGEDGYLEHLSPFIEHGCLPEYIANSDDATYHVIPITDDTDLTAHYRGG